MSMSASLTLAQNPVCTLTCVLHPRWLVPCIVTPASHPVLLKPCISTLNMQESVSSPTHMPLCRLSMLVQRLLDGKNRELAAKEDELQRAKAALKAAQVQVDRRVWHASPGAHKDGVSHLNAAALFE